MTVAGVGGRPRKWRSDTDRVRAFRARQRGEAEPATVEAAVADGDETAIAWEQVRQLGATIEAMRKELSGLKVALRRLETDLNRQHARFSWVDRDNVRLRSDLAEVKRERDELQLRLDELRRARSAPADSSTTSTTPRQNRARRRRADRDRRRPPYDST